MQLPHLVATPATMALLYWWGEEKKKKIENHGFVNYFNDQLTNLPTLKFKFLNITHWKFSLWAGVLGDGLGSLRHGVFSQLPGQQQPHRSLHLSAGDGGALVVLSQAGRFCGNPLEQVIDEGVHDAHGSARNPRVRMNLRAGRRVAMQLN